MFYYKPIDKYQSDGQDAVNAVRPAAPNATGIPDHMKARFEAASGMSLDDVRIHYNSARPAQLNALAYTQGTNVYLGAGQEKHLSHELGHVIQQKRGLVPVSRWLNGLPLNDDARLEAEADRLARYQNPAQPAGLPSNIVQRKMDAEVALVPKVIKNILFSPEDLMVDTVKLSGRADTGLETKDGQKTQGDHIIADVLVKKYQKVMCRGQILSNVFNFYRNITNEMKYENAIADKYMQRMPKEKRDQIQEERIASSNKTADTIAEVIARGEKEIKNIPGWRKHMNEIVRLYNDAYSNSYFATHGVGTGGHGEAEAMKYIRDEMSKGTVIRPCFTNKLIDIGSLKSALADIGIAESDMGKRGIIVANRFSMMLEQMLNYKKRREGWIKSYSMTEKQQKASAERRNHERLLPSEVPEDLFDLLKYSLYYSPEEIRARVQSGKLLDYAGRHDYPADSPDEQIVMGLLQESLGVSAIMDQQVEFEICSCIYGRLSGIGGFLQENGIYTQDKAFNITKLKKVQGQMVELLSYCKDNPTTDSTLQSIYKTIDDKGTELRASIAAYSGLDSASRSRSIAHTSIVGILQWAAQGAETCKSLCENQKAAFTLRDSQPGQPRHNLISV